MKNNTYRLKTPLDADKIRILDAGDLVYLSGTVYSARDMAHNRIVKAIKNKQSLPVDLKDITIFYAGPSPTPPGKKSGSVGPTTSIRMDSLTEPLLRRGMRAMIGKGRRSDRLKGLLKKNKAIYLVSVGGISAYLASRVESIKPIAYEDLGAGAIYKIEVTDFPLFVAYDIRGGDIFEEALLVL